MGMTYEEYAESRGRCIKRSTLVQMAEEQHVGIDTLIQQANTQGITVVMWA
ncbi:MAG: hypothetical protein AB7D36_05485 [Oscillospiraceae bacterium]